MAAEGQKQKVKIKMKVNVLAIGVHPDDVELSCSGTLLRHIDLGYSIGLLDLTRGEMGTRGTAKTRKKEGLASAKIMGASFRRTLNLGDGFFNLGKKNKKKVIKVIRDCQPDIVLANALSDRHPDHGRAAQLITDACFLAGLSKVETKQDGKKQNPWRPKVIYHYIQDHTLHPDLVVDITPYMDKKLECILAYKTQFFDPGAKVKGPQTPISSEDFFESIKAKNRIHGRYISAKFGEGFNVVRPVGVNDLFSLE